VERVLRNKDIAYKRGVNISVPAVTLQLPHTNQDYQKIQPATVEMELASCFTRARDIGMRAAAVLIISDNRSSALGDERKRNLRHEAKIKILKAFIGTLPLYDLQPLQTKKTFSIDDHLASIIHDPSDEVNVYKKNLQKEEEEGKSEYNKKKNESK
jgi:hypothetical protein